MVIIFWLNIGDFLPAQNWRFSPDAMWLISPDANISESSGASTEVEALCDLFRGEGELTYDMAHAFVDRILVYPDERIEIQWKYCDCFSRNEETK